MEMEERVQPYYYVYHSDGILYYFLCGKGIKNKFYYDFFVVT